MVEETSDAELIERARRLRSMIGPSGVDRYTVEAVKLVQLLAARLTTLTTPEPWRSPSELPEEDGIVWVKNSGGHVELICYFADGRGFLPIPDVTGWKPIVRPLP